jgi:hypothetical protein
MSQVLEDFKRTALAKNWSNAIRLCNGLSMQEMLRGLDGLPEAIWALNWRCSPACAVNHCCRVGQLEASFKANQLIFAARPGWRLLGPSQGLASRAVQGKVAFKLVRPGSVAVRVSLKARCASYRRVPRRK